MFWVFKRVHIGLLGVLLSVLAHGSVRADPLSAMKQDPAICHAVEASGLVSSAEAADLTITFPREGETLRVREFPLQYSMSGDLVGARLDHVHWQLSEGANTTAPDLSGVVDVVASRDGDHEFIVYMATPEHVVINQKVHLRFRVMTRGSALLTPESGTILKSSDVTVYYGTYGDVPVNALMNFRVDNGAVTTDSDGDGAHTISAVANGLHQLSIWLIDADGNAVGDVETRNIAVDSPLDIDNAKRALSLATKTLKTADAGKRKRHLRSLKKLLKSMGSGGASSPDDLQLTSVNVSAAIKLAKRAETALSDDKVLKRLKKLLGTMAR